MKSVKKDGQEMKLLTNLIFVTIVWTCFGPPSHTIVAHKNDDIKVQECDQ